MLVSAIVTLTNSASGSKKKPQERITNGSPVMIRTNPTTVMPRL